MSYYGKSTSVTSGKEQSTEKVRNRIFRYLINTFLGRTRVDEGGG